MHLRETIVLHAGDRRKPGDPAVEIGFYLLMGRLGPDICVENETPLRELFEVERREVDHADLYRPRPTPAQRRSPAASNTGTGGRPTRNRPQSRPVPQSLPRWRRG